jgi:hypothetical protein
MTTCQQQPKIDVPQIWGPKSGRWKRLGLTARSLKIKKNYYSHLKKIKTVHIGTLTVF